MTALPVTLPPVFAPALILAVALCACPLSAQDAGGATQERPNPLLFSADDVVTEFYTPENSSVHELIRVAAQFHGRSFYVEERGGYNARPLENLQLLGDSILIYDKPDYTTSLLAALKLLDRGNADEPGRQAIVTRHWSPGFVSVNTGLGALQPFNRSVFLVDDQGREHAVGNVSMLQNQNVLVLRDSPDQVDQMLELLEVIDQPETQLMVTTMVLRGVRGDSEDDVPAELTRHLSQLVPYDTFSVEAMGMVRTSARAREIQIKLDGRNRLVFEPDAFDRESLSLSGMCHFDSADGFQFETRTSVAAGEYTVLGAAGEVPLLVVLRIMPLDK
jgi:hypothetical protein